MKLPQHEFQTQWEIEVAPPISSRRIFIEGDDHETRDRATRTQLEDATSPRAREDVRRCSARDGAYGNLIVESGVYKYGDANLTYRIGKMNGLRVA